MINFENRLASLKSRRQGTAEIAALNEHLQFGTEAYELLHPAPENFERLSEPAGIKYAIGAMASVGEKYTETSINEGNRVANAVTSGLHTLGELVTCRMQGSVALDIHIKGFSDVDMLIICNNPISTQRPHICPHSYTDSSDPRSISQIVYEIGNHAEQLLASRFYKATVKRGSKSIAVEGGSLTRKVDIVPSIWYDSHEYQRSKLEHDRGIQIYDISDSQLHANYPFLHIRRVNERDAQYSGNLKSLIRLIKNMVADMPEQKQKQAKKLTSYDIAAICFHMENNLYAPNYFQLSLIEKLRNHLDYISNNYNYKISLTVPDDTRKIFNSPEKDDALEIIRKEITDLASSIAREINPNHWLYTPSDLLNKSVYL